MNESQESPRTRFDWRAHLRGNLENIPPAIAEKLDLLGELVNEDGPHGDDFMAAFTNGQYRNPVLSLITYSRGALTPDEIGIVHDAVVDAEKQK